MPRQPRIRWKSGEQQSYENLVKRYNRKISTETNRLVDQQKRYWATLLPDKQPGPKTAVKQIQTRKQLQQETKRMENFLRTGKAFQVDKRTETSLRSTVKSFNAKVARLEKKAHSQGERAALPKRISFREVLKDSSSIEALRDNIKTYRGFLEKGAEELVTLPDSKFNIKLTQWQKDTMEKKLGTINEAREKERQDWLDTEVRAGGQGAGYTQREARLYRGQNDKFQPMTMYNYSSDYTDVHRKFDQMMREDQPGYWDRRIELARHNYMGVLDEYIPKDSDIGKFVIEKLNGLDIKDFKRDFKAIDDIFLKAYKLKDDEEAAMEALEAIYNDWFHGDLFEDYADYLEKKAGGY